MINPQRQAPIRQPNCKILLVFLVLLLLASCQNQTELAVNQRLTDFRSTALDSDQVQYIRKTLAMGPKLYKYNCAVCHRPGGATCQSVDQTRDLQYTFTNLCLDSLPYYTAYVKDTRSCKSTKSRNPYIIHQHRDSLYLHNFGESLADSSIKTLMEYIWLVHRKGN